MNSRDVHPDVYIVITYRRVHGRQFLGDQSANPQDVTAPQERERQWFAQVLSQKGFIGPQWTTINLDDMVDWTSLPVQPNNNGESVFNVCFHVHVHDHACAWMISGGGLLSRRSSHLEPCHLLSWITEYAASWSTPERSSASRTYCCVSSA